MRSIPTGTALNRLISSTSNQGWGQGYNYDGYGNLTAKTALAGSVPTFTAAYDLNNRQVGFTYDANGNQLSDPAGVLTSGYDVENRLTWGTKSGASVANGYGYDPDNRRVYLSKWVWNAGAGEWRLTGGGYEEVIYYGVTGQKMGTYRLAADASGLYLTAVGYNVYFGGRLVRKVAADGTATIVRADRLGSFGRFHAYGEERGTPPPENTEKFTTYYRDGDTGLDYAVNRYYSSRWGRFLTPDPSLSTNAIVLTGNWNRYAYVGGDPANRVDPRGLCSPQDQPPCYSTDVLGESDGRGGAGGGGSGTDGMETTNEGDLSSGGRPLVPQEEGYVFAKIFSDAVANSQMSDCEALAAYAGVMATIFGNRSDFVSSFGVFVPLSDPSVRWANDHGYSVPANTKPVIMLPAGTAQSGFKSEYQDSRDKINIDQVHHFAAFFELGYSAGFYAGTFAAIYKDIYPYNSGDISLGAFAAELGALLRSNLLSPGGIAGRIKSSLCK